jgi:hypothetical protein
VTGTMQQSAAAALLGMSKEVPGSVATTVGVVGFAAWWILSSRGEKYIGRRNYKCVLPSDSSRILPARASQGFSHLGLFLQRTGHPRRLRERVAPYSEEEACPVIYRCSLELSPLSILCAAIRTERATLPSMRLPTLDDSNTRQTNVGKRRGGEK